MAQATILLPRCIRTSHPYQMGASKVSPANVASTAPAPWRRSPTAAAAGPALATTIDAARLADKDLRGTVLVTGAGPAGLAAAAALHQVGMPVLVLERQPHLSTAGSALGLWTNAWRALDALGAGDALRQQHPRVDNIELARHGGRRLRRFSLADCSGGPHEFRGVRRHNLLAALASLLPPSSLAFDTPVAAAEATSQGAAITLASGQRLDCLAVVGADGARSAVAAATGRAPPNYCGQTAIRGVAHFPGGLPPHLEAGCIRQVWGPGARAGLYPVSDSELYWFVCFYASEGTAGPASAAACQQEALDIVQGWAWGLPEVVAATPLESLSRSGLADRWDLPPLRSAGGSITLAGDALHPMTPNLGQGGCTALEDAVVLARLLQQQGTPALIAEMGSGGSGQPGAATAAAAEAVRSAFQRYERERARRCLPLTVRSQMMGTLLQLPFPPVALARDLFVQHAFSPSHFLDHATYDCGELLK